MPIKQKTDIFLSALEGASVGWLLDFRESAYRGYHPTQGRSVVIEDCLVLEEAIPELTKRALEDTRAAAKDGRLLRLRNLNFIPYRWKDLADGDVSEVRAWTDELLKDDASTIILAEAFTGQSWSAGMGMFGLGDRVAKPTTQVTIDASADFLDVALLRARLIQLSKDGQLEPEALSIAQTFLAALDKPNRRLQDDGQDM